MAKIAGVVKAICMSNVRGVQKNDVNSARLETGWGIKNDAHGGDWHRQVSLLSYDKVQKFNELGAGVSHGDFGENIVVEGIDFSSLPVGSQLKCGVCILEITQIGKECHTHCQIYHKMGDCIMPREGVFAKVVQDGLISSGDVMELFGESGRQFRASVVTLSDKASKGEREDKSGPLIAQMLEDAGYKVTGQIVLPDEQDKIENELINLADRQQMDLIITTGGTGFARRDITPEATIAVAERMAPGIAEAIRAHSLQITGRAMLSRGASAIRGSTLIVNLPGSPKAVRESLEFVLPHLGHGIEILRGDAQECAKPDESIGGAV